jgi:hypothetical protein
MSVYIPEEVGVIVACIRIKDEDPEEEKKE